MSGIASKFVTWQKNAIDRSEYYDREHCLDLFQQALNVLVEEPPASHQSVKSS